MPAWLSNLPLRRMPSFLMVGGAGFCVDAGVLRALIPFAGPVMGQVAAFLLASVVTWALNRTWTFRGHTSLQPQAVAVEWLRYVLAGAVGFGITNGLYLALLLGAGVSPVLALLTGAGMSAGVNFAMASNWVFRT
jgi:putative flippase GtrA